MIVIVNHDEVAQLQVTSSASGFACDTLHGAAISEEAESVVVDEVKSRLIELCTSMCLGYS